MASDPTALASKGAEEGRWAEWMRRAQAGDAEAYRKLFAEIAEVIEAYLRRHFGGSPYVEDCVQEALLSLHRARHTWDPRRPFRPWMFSIARHRAIDVLRGSGRRSQREEPVSDAASVANGAPSRDAALDASRLLRGVSADDREALLLTKVEGFSMREAAERVGISETAMKTRVHRALKRLQKQWEREPLP